MVQHDGVPLVHLARRSSQRRLARPIATLRPVARRQTRENTPLARQAAQLHVVQQVCQHARHRHYAHSSPGTQLAHLLRRQVRGKVHQQLHLRVPVVHAAHQPAQHRHLRRIAQQRDHRRKLAHRLPRHHTRLSAPELARGRRAGGCHRGRGPLLAGAAAMGHVGASQLRRVILQQLVLAGRHHAPNVGIENNHVDADENRNERAPQPLVPLASDPGQRRLHARLQLRHRHAVH
mmetsp:Transcript_25150/g.63426  ORF Transcript_25150/g.63426 Transcript_25150/m.63426 type:complete len:234 (-) Transcript_25150:22-723(-)